MHIKASNLLFRSPFHIPPTTYVFDLHRPSFTDRCDLSALGFQEWTSSHTQMNAVQVSVNLRSGSQACGEHSVRPV